MARNPRDSLRFRVLDVLAKKGDLTHQQVVDHLRLDPSRIMEDLERLKKDGEVVQVGARGPFRLTPAGHDAYRALAPPAEDPAERLIAMSERILKLRSARDQELAANAEHVQHKASAVEEALRLLEMAQAEHDAARAQEAEIRAKFDQQIGELMTEIRHAVS